MKPPTRTTVLALTVSITTLWIFAVGAVSAQVKNKLNPNDGLTYTWIAPGTFQMGCSSDDAECKENEGPAHPVTLTKGFWIGQTEVTNEAYKKVIGASPSHFKGGNRSPVDSVWWDEAQSYCRGVGMRLPTEAEWEYAARAGNPAPRYGSLAAVAWFSANSGGTSHEVAQKAPNAFGLYDMLGNVWEWVADGYAPYSAAAATDPKGLRGAEQHVIRGGSCFHDQTLGRASARGWGGRGHGANDYGLRCAGD